jgi:hypothetical protein
MTRSQRLSLRSSIALSGLTALLAACGPALAQQPTVPAACTLRFVATLSPDVPNPRDSSFVSSLLGDHGGYALYLEHVIDDTHLDMLLVGPGPRRNCRQVLDSIGKDSRIQSVNVTQQ